MRGCVTRIKDFCGVMLVALFALLLLWFTLAESHSSWTLFSLSFGALLGFVLGVLGRKNTPLDAEPPPVNPKHLFWIGIAPGLGSMLIFFFGREIFEPLMVLFGITLFSVFFTAAFCILFQP